MTFLPWFHYALIGFLVARLGLLPRTAASAFILPALIVVPRKPSSSPSSLHATANEGYVQVSRPDGRKHQLFYRIARPMSLSSTQAAPIVALHGGPSVPSSYLYPLEDVVPYRSIVFYDQLGCGKSDEPKDLNQYSIKDSVEDLKLLLKKLGIRRFHLYGQSYGGILAYEYMKSVANSGNSSTSSSSDNNPECLSAILSSAPSNVSQIEGKFISLLDELKKSHAKDNEEELSDAELQDLFRINHQCRMPEMPSMLKDAYGSAGTVWRGTDAISDYVATPPDVDASRMPSSLIMRGEYDFVSEECVENWKSVFNTKFLRYKTLPGCSHHGLYEDGVMYGDIIDTFCSEYD